MKFVVLTSVYGREEVVRRSFKNIRQNIYRGIVHKCVAVVVAVSEDWAFDLVKSLGWVPVMTENKPVGRKMNTALKKVMEYEFNYMVQFDSDALILSNFWKTVQPFIESKFSLFGFSELLFINSETKEERVYDYGCMCCSGRFVSREALMKASMRVEVEYNCNLSTPTIHGKRGARAIIPFKLAETLARKRTLSIIGEPVVSLWPDKDKGLDHATEIALFEAGYNHRILKPKEPVVADIKTPDNIWPWENYFG